ncbi:hypothetical protein [Massilia glaciei]|uniref:hypothetical protein n=1 Tax=Massilia glaciei TaxID=1524097 RepID=UPI0015E7F125|nr:hypothetical protein [Massilia glaciei]
MTLLWSFDGHAEKWEPPFVILVASNSTAFKLHQILGPNFKDKGLLFYWSIKGSFLDDGTMQCTNLLKHIPPLKITFNSE